MNYYNKIKQELLDNELNKKIKDYSIRLTNELGRKYSVRYLFDIRKLYLFSKVHPLDAQLTLSHYRLLFPLNDKNEIIYYINQIIKRNLSKRELAIIIKSNEYKIKVDDKYNYIDLLLFNYEYNCFVVIELKVVELKKEHIGQIQVYMNYIDDNLKKPLQNKTVGIIICKHDSNYVIKYCSDKRVISREYYLL